MMDATNTRSSSFWANLGKNYLQIAENVLPQLGAQASDALAQRYGGNAPDVTVSPQNDGSGANQNKWLIVGGAVLVGLILLFAVARPIHLGR